VATSRQRAPTRRATSSANSNRPSIIPMDGRPHPGPNIRSRLGDSRGRWSVIRWLSIRNFSSKALGGRRHRGPSSRSFELSWCRGFWQDRRRHRSREAHFENVDR
jgi:hypothetical protein